MPKTAIVTGITGQDGAYMADLLLQKNYKVIGTYRRTSSVNFWRIEYLGIDNHPNLSLVEHDVTDPGDCYRLILQTKPNEIYNLAAQSFVHVSFNQPYTTAQITGIGTLNMLEAVRNIDPDIRFYQASTSELYGMVQEIPQSETTPFYPRSPYAAAKLYAHWITVNYRESYNIFGCSGILFNHESPLRGIEFVTRKTTVGVARIKLGLAEQLRLGNLDAKRDWGYAKDYVEGMYLMLQADKPDSYVLATGKMQTVRDFVSMAFAAADIEIQWQGTGLDEIGIDTQSGKTLIVVDQDFYRPAEVDLLIGDATKAKTELGWEPTTELSQLCEMMVESDIKKIQNNRVF